MGAVVQFRAKDQKDEIADPTLLVAVMESCPEGVAIVEAGRVIYANRAFACAFGYCENSDVAGRSLADFIPESLFLFSTDPESGQPAARECDGVCQDGRETRVLVASAVFRSSQRELQLIHLGAGTKSQAEAPAVADTPEGKPRNSEPDRAELQEHQLQRLQTMGRVVGGVAHDFNNLLTGILLYCDLLTHGLDPASPLRGYVQEIRKASGHSSGLIQQLLSAADSHSGEKGLHRWDEVISGMQNFLARMLGENIELVTDFDLRAAAPDLGETVMRQIVLNLLLNSRDAMPEGGRITLRVRNCVDCVDTPSELLAGYVEFSVSDTGCGMDAGTRSRMFEPFFTTKSNHGNGLGLATVQRIVSEANGSLEVESQPGQGTRVSVRVPHAEASQLTQSSQTPIRA